jgi:hypothetical protein
MVLLAFSLQHQVEKYGAYVGIASFFGLAVLSLLYFAQAREVRRLRDWAGRAPERAQEMEERVVAQAEAVRRVPPPVAARPPAPVAAAAAPATNGAHKLKPEEIAALAFARAAGVPEPPHPPKPVPVPVAVAAPPAEEAAPAAEPRFDPAPDVTEDAVAGNGHANGEVPAPATPAARRAPAAPLRATPPPRRPAPAPARRVSAGPPPRRESSGRSIALTIGLGVVIVAAAVFVVLHFITGGSGNKPVSAAKVPVVNAGSGGSKTAKKGKKAVTPSPTTFRPTTTVSVLNGTYESGLAATAGDKLTQAGYGTGNVKAGNNLDRNVTTSAVMFKSGARTQGNDVAKILDIKTVRPMDDATAAAGGGKDVVVIVGQDQFK